MHTAAHTLRAPPPPRQLAAVSASKSHARRALRYFVQIRWTLSFSLFGTLVGMMVLSQLGPLATWLVLRFCSAQLPADFRMVFAWVGGTLHIELRNVLCQPALVAILNKSVPQPYAAARPSLHAANKDARLCSSSHRAPHCHQRVPMVKCLAAADEG
jgi:hypothetical protein